MQASSAPELNLFDPRIIPDPYPVYHALRAQDPVLLDVQTGLWLVSGYAEVVAALRDSRFKASRVASADQLREFGLEALRPLFSALRRMMLFADPTDHTRRRGLVSRAFTPRVVEALRPQIQRIVDGLLDAVEDRATSPTRFRRRLSPSFWACRRRIASGSSGGRTTSPRFWATSRRRRSRTWPRPGRWRS